jgi:hypothetical protein
MALQRRVTLLAAAKADLERLRHDDPELVPLALRMLRDLEQGAADGQPLDEMAAAGVLRDCRTLYFGRGAPPTHRIVYRVLPDERIEVLEVVAVEAREDRYVSLLAAQRLGRLPTASQRRFTRLHQATIARRSQVRVRRPT